MKKSIKKNNYFNGFEFLPAKANLDYIEIYHPFDKLAKDYFNKKGLTIAFEKSNSIIISYENMTIEEKIKLSSEIKLFLKSSRQKVISSFLIYSKNGISYL